MIRPSLTQAERDVFTLIRRELVAGRLAPSYQELSEELELASKSGIHRVIKSLIAKGYLSAGHGRARSIALVPGADAYTVYLPAEIDARLSQHVAAWASLPEAVIVQAVTEYLARRP